MILPCQTQSNISSCKSKTVCCHLVGAMIIYAETGGAADCGTYSVTMQASISKNFSVQMMLSSVSVQVVVLVSLRSALNKETFEYS